MLCCISGHTRQYGIENECIKEKARVTPIVGKMVESHIMWFRHVWKRPIKVTVRRVNQMEYSPIASDKRRSRKNMGETIKRDFGF